ncbi:DUF418 domain-containing protein [Perlabentimonas gracilis]|uniref:DUF418 domain-containing protein n=1 Tax=Perlabentimonas gracilis TaxID=2715279 RepID=UPI00140749D2|nr:DUF418 domain-containing protein [Perlabentimonas gracilis]NHB68539.1 DUF418 domain-containing protein [Perlabentimonas gracilis]
MSENFKPIAPKERIKEIDFVRGFALLGILLVNMAIFRSSIFEMTLEQPFSGGTLNSIASGFIYFFAEGKFYSLFSLLFGFGFSIFLLKEKTQRILMDSFFKRRMLGLLLFGLVHAFLLWSGDILITYSLVGFLLIAFKRVSVKGLIKWSVGLIVFILLFQILIFGIVELLQNLPNMDFVLEQFEKVESSFAEKAQLANEVYSGTNYLEMIRMRTVELAQQYSGFMVIFPSVLAMFLIGLAFGKSGKLNSISENKPFLRRVFWISLLIGLPIAALHPFGVFNYSRLAIDMSGAYHIIGFFLGSPILALAYFTGGLLLYSRFSQVKVLQMVASTGRMALTNYLLQSIVCTTIFYGYGLGLYGKVDAFQGLLITLIVWGIQLPISHWWLNRYKFGPAEWLWRWITYGKRISNKIN